MWWSIGNSILIDLDISYLKLDFPAFIMNIHLALVYVERHNLLDGSK
jgi:hypothetical protein